MGQSYRGGRIGEESFILDGLGVKNQLDAATGGLGLQHPARSPGRGVAGDQRVLRALRPGAVRPGQRRHPRSRRDAGRAAPPSRPTARSAARSTTASTALAVRAGGPIAGGVGLVAAIDVAGRLDDDPVNAPPPDDPARPAHRPARSPAPQQRRAVERRRQAGRPGRQRGGAPRLRHPLRGPAAALRPRLQVRPRFRAGAAAPGRPRERPPPVRTDPRSSVPLIVDLRAGRFVREFLRGQLDGTVDYKVGALTGSRFHIVGEDEARALSQSPDPIAGLGRAGAERRARRGACRRSSSAGASRGDLAWNRFGETRLQLDATYGGIRRVDLFVGGECAAQQVRTYQRVLGVPARRRHRAARRPCRRSRRGAWRATSRRRRGWPTSPSPPGLRYDQFDSRTESAAESRGRAAVAEPAVRRLDRAEGRHRRRELRPVHPGARLPVPGGRGLRRHHAHRPLPPRQPRPRLSRRATQYEFSVRYRPTRGDLAPGRRVPEAARRPRRLGAARRESRTRRSSATPTPAPRAGSRCWPSASCGTATASGSPTPCRMPRPPRPIRSCSTA